jgi:ketosteroid isomerase-like protein
MMFEPLTAARGFTDTRPNADPRLGSGRPLPQSEGHRFHAIDGRHERGSQHQWMSGLLALLLGVASLIALHEVAQTPMSRSNEANSMDSFRTIRGFYAGLDEFMETGDASALSKTLAPDALAFVPEQGIMGEDSGLLTYLLALRATYPRLRFSIETIDASGDIAIASVRTTGTAMSPPASTWPSASGTSKEFFRIDAGRIVEHWTTTPGSVLQFPLTAPPMRIEVFQPGHLAIAKLTISPQRNDPQFIEGPALVIVERGHLTLEGNGSSEIVSIATGATYVPRANELGSARPGQAISIPDHRAFVGNEDSERATALIATLVEDAPQILEHLPGYHDSLTTTINDMSTLGSGRTTTHGAVTVRPLAFDHRTIPTGTWDLEIGWVVLGPGALLPLATEGESAIAQGISGSASAVIPGQHNPELLDTLTNDGDKPVVALVIWLHATH